MRQVGHRLDVGPCSAAQDDREHQTGSYAPRRIRLIAIQAATGFSAILDIHPHDPLVLMQLAPLLVQLDATDQALELCLAAYTHLREKEPHVSLNQQTSFFDEAALALLAELLTLRGRSSEAVHLIRSGARWLQGREKETGWDVLDDDREFDLKRQTRLGWEKDAKYLEQVKVFALDRRLRARLGIARLHQDRISEAKVSAASLARC